MALSDKLWETVTTVIKMNDRIVSLSAQMQAQQQRIEDLTARVIRLETPLEIALGSRSDGRIEPFPEFPARPPVPADAAP